jgi:ribosomal protein S20
MVRHKSAEKAARQSVKRQSSNRMALAKLRTTIKKFRGELTGKISDKAATKEKLKPELDIIQRFLMKAAHKGIVKKGTASRQIARLNLALNRAVS